MVSPRLSLAVCAVAVVCGCRRDTEPAKTQADNYAGDEVVVYTALDRAFSEPILEGFTAQTGIRTRPVYDTESTKTVGLVNRIRAEAARPRCDVFWNNEILNTLRLKHEGLLQTCQVAQAENYPERFRDPEGYWFGFAARARVLIVNTQLVPAELCPTSVKDLADPRWRGRTGIAKPLFGTTASHVACWFALLGEKPAAQMLAAFKANGVQIAAGNKACAEMVGAGRLAFALTDTDDALEEEGAGKPVRIVFPDGGEGQMGTLLLPNTVALVKGCPHRDAGARLLDYLLSPDVEQRLADGPAGQIPLHRAVIRPSRVGALQDIRPMNVDLARAADAFGVAAKYIEDEFLAP
jgi:iron(III) transport system substrate-binding protein